MADDWAGFEAIEVPKAKGPATPVKADDWSQFEAIGPGVKPAAKVEPKPEATPIGVGDVGRSLARGVPILGGLASKANAATYAALAPLFPNDETISHAPTWGERYDEGLQRENARDEKFATEHPVVNTAAELTGGVASMIPAAATATGAKLLGITGPNLLSRSLTGGASGALLGGADSATRDQNPVTGAEIGGALGLAGPVAGRLIGSVARGARDLVMPHPAPTVGEFGIPLSKGQQTQNFDAIMMEQAAARGGMGPKPQGVAQEFFDNQRNATEAARSGISRDMSPTGTVVADNPQTAAELVSEGVRAKAAEAKAGYKAAYDEAAAIPGTIDRGAMDQVGTSIRQRLTLGDHPVIVDEQTTPFAARALADLDQQIGNTRYTNRAAPDAMRTETFPASAIDGVGLSDIDQARKRLISFYQDAKGASAPGVESADVRATRSIIGALDDHVEQAINAGLFKGDERALPALKAARAAYSDYRKTFTPQGAGDEAGRVVQQILGRHTDQAASPTQISNWLYGASGIGNTGTSVKVAQRVRGIMGADSPEWTGVRQGMWEKLTGATEGRTDWGPQKVSERVFEFLNGGGKPLSQVLFSPAERGQMANFAGVLKQMVPPPGAVNHSNTAPVLAKIAGQALNGVTAMLGFHAAGPVGGLAGYAANALRKGLQERSAVNRVRDSLYGSPQLDALVNAANQRSAQAGGFASRAVIPAFDDRADR